MLFGEPKPFQKNKYKKSECHKKLDTVNLREKRYKQMTIEDFGFSSIFPQRKKRFFQIIKNISYRLIRNDNTQQNLIWLLAVKNVFEMELFNLTPNYIAQFVFDPSHQVLVLFEDGEVIGGICFRVFDKISEIVFCAISQKFKSKGYGSYMMSIYKKYMQVIGVTDLFTYADNNAFVFFSRHGFSLHCSIMEKAWKNKLKDYIGATLVSAHIYPSFDYERSDFILNSQIEELEKKLETVQIMQASKWPIQMVSGINIDQFSSANIFSNMKAAIYKIRQIPASDLFARPIVFPEYMDVVKYPMDFQTITAKVFGQYKEIYKTFTDFENDVNQIFKNCYIYNKTKNAYTIAADDLYPKVQKILSEYKIYCRLLRI